VNSRVDETAIAVISVRAPHALRLGDPIVSNHVSSKRQLTRIRFGRPRCRVAFDEGRTQWSTRSTG
jgi:hypothetical protein